MGGDCLGVLDVSVGVEVEGDTCDREGMVAQESVRKELLGGGWGSERSTGNVLAVRSV